MFRFRIIAAILVGLMIAAGLVLVSLVDKGATCPPEMLTSNRSPALTASPNEDNAYRHLYEVMDKYHKSFDVYTDQDAGGNHYAPSGWMGGLEDITFEGDWTSDCHSGTHCIRITYSADYYEDNHYIPSGWMGDWGDIAFDDNWTTDPHSGDTCIRINYSALSSQGQGWAGIYWQDPENNWGDKEGGYDLAGATKLTFWARGESGGEKAEFKVGGINRPPYYDPSKPYQDSCDALSTGIVALTEDWAEYTIDLISPSYFEIYTDKEAGGNNHYIPSGWYNGSSNMTFDDSWSDNCHSGTSCTKVTWNGEPGDDGWKWNGVAWQQPENNWEGDRGLGYDLTGATKLTFWARTDDPGLELKFLVGYPDDSSGEVLMDLVWTEVYTNWTQHEIDLSDLPPGKDLSDIVCGFAFLFNDVHDPDPDGCTFYLDDIKFDRLIEKDLSHIIGGFVGVTNVESNPDGCTFYLDDIRYEYEDKTFNVYTDAQHNWAGIYWQDPENNWGDKPGYDLTGATELTFWARGENGGEKAEFKVGGINRPPYYDPSKPYQDSFGPITTGVITLTKEWREYTIDLTSEVLTNISGGFCWVTNNSQNPNGCTFYLDDIKYDKERLDDLRFLVSYETTSAPDDKYVRNSAFIYDNALAMLAFMARGNEEDLERAKILGDAFVYSQNHDRCFTDGGLRNAYQSGDIAIHYSEEESDCGIPLTSTARLPGWWNAKERRWDEDSIQVGSYTGNVAWAMIPLLHYHETKRDSAEALEYLEAAECMGEWIYDNCYSTSDYGGYTGGYEGWGPRPNQTKVAWKSTEHNIDVYVAFMKLYEAIGRPWGDRAMHAKRFVRAMWNEDDGHFWTGTDNDGTINEDSIPADASTWGLMALGEVDKYGAGVTWVEDHCYVDPCPVCNDWKGFDFSYCADDSKNRDGIWWEGTAHMCIAYRIRNAPGDPDKSDEFIKELRRVQTSANNNNGRGIVAACHDGVTTCFGWVYNNRLYIGATAWYVFAEREHNPYWRISTSDRIPYEGIYELRNIYLPVVTKNH